MSLIRRYPSDTYSGERVGAPLRRSGVDHRDRRRQRAEFMVRHDIYWV